jgi:hypothetical protein
VVVRGVVKSVGLERRFSQLSVWLSCGTENKLATSVPRNPSDSHGAPFRNVEAVPTTSPHLLVVGYDCRTAFHSTRACVRA